jgi:cell division protein FtsZ
MTEGTFKFDLPQHHKSIIKVIGVGGGGSNAVNHMYNLGIKDVEFIVCNTDVQALHTSPVPNKLQIGVNLTEGLGAGANPEQGKNAALESKESIREMLQENTKMVFVTAGMGGGTGTGAAPVIADVAKQLGILTVGIVTVPFKFEGKKKMKQAMEGVDALKKSCDTVLVILNDKLMDTFGKLTVTEAFGKADDVLTTGAKGIAEIITVPGIVNVDFEDVKTVMQNSGAAVMGSSETSGESRATRAAEAAINSPLLNNQNIKGADKILLSIVSGEEDELQMDELTEITDFMQEIAGEDAEVIFGHGIDPELGNSIRVTVIATGFEDKKEEEEAPQVVQEVEQTNDEIVEPEKKVFDLESQNQISMFTEEITRTIEKEIEDENAKEKLYSFERPEVKQEYDIPFEVENYDDMELYEKSEEDFEKDAELEELDGMAHPASRKVTLMEQSEARRKKLDGIKTDDGIDAKEFKEKLDTPAYLRKRVNLENVPAASERLVSRFNLNDDNEILGNNRFLHDNVD